jgi:hypothetical protein
MPYNPLLNRAWLAGAVAIILASWVPARAQDSRWSAPADATAKSLIDMERQWAQAACTHDGIEKTILAEDFYGTAPDGSRYSKQQEIARSSGKITEEACTLYEVKVHFYGDSMAILYGSESAIHNEPDGRKHRVKLTWTDTWLKRDGKWQIVAAQDMPSDVP